VVEIFPVIEVPVEHLENEFKDKEVKDNAEYEESIESSVLYPTSPNILHTEYSDKPYSKHDQLVVNAIHPTKVIKEDAQYSLYGTFQNIYPSEAIPHNIFPEESIYPSYIEEIVGQNVVRTIREDFYLSDGVLPPMGDVTETSSTVIMTGVTTIYNTKVLGTVVSGDYAQLVMTGSKIFTGQDYQDSPGFAGSVQVTQLPTFNIENIIKPTTTEVGKREESEYSDVGFKEKLRQKFQKFKMKHNDILNPEVTDTREQAYGRAIELNEDGKYNVSDKPKFGKRIEHIRKKLREVLKHSSKTNDNKSTLQRTFVPSHLKTVSPGDISVSVSMSLKIPERATRVPNIFQDVSRYKQNILQRLRNKKVNKEDDEAESEGDLNEESVKDLPEQKVIPSNANLSQIVTNLVVTQLYQGDAVDISPANPQLVTTSKTISLIPRQYNYETIITTPFISPTISSVISISSELSSFTSISISPNIASTVIPASPYSFEPGLHFKNIDIELDGEDTKHIDTSLDEVRLGNLYTPHPNTHLSVAQSSLIPLQGNPYQGLKLPTTSPNPIFASPNYPFPTFPSPSFSSPIFPSPTYPTPNLLPRMPALTPSQLRYIQFLQQQLLSQPSQLGEELPEQESPQPSVSVISSPVIKTTMMTLTHTEEYKIRFRNKPIMTTVTNTKVVSTVITSYITSTTIL